VNCETVEIRVNDWGVFCRSLKWFEILLNSFLCESCLNENLKVS
jgi:hypothetical protein